MKEENKCANPKIITIHKLTNNIVRNIVVFLQNGQNIYIKYLKYNLKKCQSKYLVVEKAAVGGGEVVGGGGGGI